MSQTIITRADQLRATRLAAGLYLSSSHADVSDVDFYEAIHSDPEDNELRARMSLWEPVEQYVDKGGSLSELVDEAAQLICNFAESVARPALEAHIGDPLLAVFAAEVIAEVQRARKKFPSNEHLTVALMEEAGEVAKAQLERAANLREECVQSACVAARIAIEGDADFTGDKRDYSTP
jgi:NTP pyrophosphatase (non-canonical NTP hydrolase)